MEQSQDTQNNLKLAHSHSSCRVSESALSPTGNTTTAGGGVGAVQSQVVLILVGLIGRDIYTYLQYVPVLRSGKSTFAQALEEHWPNFRRCNQDELGNRRAVESLARGSLRDGLSVCIDRTNIDARQRTTWISIAREMPGAEAWVLLFDTPFKVCEGRLRIRENHPTITSTEQALEVLQRFRSQYQVPRRGEGYDRELRLAVDEQQLNYTADDIQGILCRIQTSPKIVQQNGRWPHQGDYNSHRGHPSYRGYPNFRGSTNHRGSTEYRGSPHYRGYSVFRGSTKYWAQVSSLGHGRGGSSTPYLRSNGSFNDPHANNSYSPTYSAGGSTNNGEGSV